jgi:hypothetical protein
MTIVKLLLAITWAASVAAAQTQLSGTAQCSGKPTESYTIEVGDHPGHAYVISKGPCTWTKPMEIAGLKSKDQTGVDFSEIDGNKSRTHGSGVGSMDNGDKFYFRNQDAPTMNDQKPESGELTFTFTGGTGKLKGLKGKGTVKCTPEGDNVNCDIIQGEYSLPTK